MSAINRKLMLIKRLLKQVEDDCQMTLLLESNNAPEHIDSVNAMTIQICFEVIQYIMNMSDVPDNVHVIRVYVTSEDHLKCVEFYSTCLSIPFDDIEIDFRLL